MATHRPFLWAIKSGAFIELYDIYPYESDATCVADFTVKDFESYCGLTVTGPERTPFRVRLHAAIARHK